MSKYTDAQVEALQAQDVWTYDEAVEFADQEALKVRSVIAKIKSLGLDYECKPVAVTKTGEPVVRKSDLAAEIATRLGVEAPSLVKMTKTDLVALSTAVLFEVVEQDVA